MFINFPGNIISPVATIFTLLQDVFSSKPNPQFEILK